MKSKKTKTTLIVNVAIIALIFYVVVSLFLLQIDVDSYRKKLTSLQSQCEEQKIVNGEMQGLIARDFDADYIVKMAREKLGLIFPDERVFFNTSGNQ